MRELFKDLAYSVYISVFTKVFLREMLGYQQIAKILIYKSITQSNDIEERIRGISGEAVLIAVSEIMVEL